jgi:hypothetical protein
MIKIYNNLEELIKVLKKRKDCTIFVEAFFLENVIDNEQYNNIYNIAKLKNIEIDIID